jgi:hypothetical protein
VEEINISACFAYDCTTIKTRAFNFDIKIIYDYVMTS